MKFIEVVENKTGLRHLIPVQAIVCLEQLDPAKHDGAASKLWMGYRSLNVTCKDRYDDVVASINKIPAP